MLRRRIAHIAIIAIIAAAALGICIAISPVCPVFDAGRRDRARNDPGRAHCARPVTGATVARCDPGLRLALRNKGIGQLLTGLLEGDTKVFVGLAGRTSMGRVARKPPPNDLYARDFYAWTQEQARLLRERRFGDLDLENLIGEVASVGGSEKREIGNRLAILIGHLLKWTFQPGARSSSWRGTIDEQRRQIAQVLKTSPSLRSYPATVFGDSYLSGRLLASRESGIDFTLFPEEPPFTLDEAVNENFLPREPDLLRP